MGEKIRKYMDKVDLLQKSIDNLTEKLIPYLDKMMQDERAKRECENKALKQKIAALHQELQELRRQIKTADQVLQFETSPSVLNLPTPDTWNVYKRKLLRLDDIERFAAKHAEAKLSFCQVHLQKAKQALAELSLPKPQDFADGRTNGKMADFVVKYAQRWLVAIELCDRMQGTEWQTPATDLKRLIEAYLTRIKLTPLSFKTGDDEDDWQDLEIPDSINTKQTDNQNLIRTIASVERQPYEIRYLDENGEVIVRTFGGKCTIWVADDLTIRETIK